MEIKMHWVFKNKYVAHYHPVYILPYLCAKEYNFKNYNVIDFVLPGNDLYEMLSKNYIYEEKGIVLLRNHGVVIYAEQIQDVLELYNQLKMIFLRKMILHILQMMRLIRLMGSCGYLEMRLKILLQRNKST